MKEEIRIIGCPTPGTAAIRRHAGTRDHGCSINSAARNVPKCAMIYVYARSLRVYAEVHVAIGWETKEVTMEFSQLIHARRSVRTFAGRPVEHAKLGAILEAACLAPSAGNLQAYEIYQVTSARARAALARAADQAFVALAPICLAFFANPGRSARKYGARGRDLYALQDATIAACYAQLTATDLGLASVWVGAFDDSAVTAAIGAPGDWVPVAILPIGYAAEEPEPTPRRTVDDLVHML
jgi:nitroreductase